MARFDELAPLASTQRSTGIRGTISGEDTFRLYDTFGFPIDLTELMARERGYTVDIAGFEAALAGQRKQSQDERKSRRIVGGGGRSRRRRQVGAARSRIAAWACQRFVGYDAVRRRDESRSRCGASASRAWP